MAKVGETLEPESQWSLVYSRTHTTDIWGWPRKSIAEPRSGQGETQFMGKILRSCWKSTITRVEHYSLVKLGCAQWLPFTGQGMKVGKGSGNNGLSKRHRPTFTVVSQAESICYRKEVAKQHLICWTFSWPKDWYRANRGHVPDGDMCQTPYCDESPQNGQDYLKAGKSEKLAYREEPKDEKFSQLDTAPCCSWHGSRDGVWDRR